MGWGAVIGGAVSAAGSLASSGMSARQAKRMYRHRYQWAMEDARRAGLNPMLVATQGAPPVPQSPGYENFGEAAVTGAARVADAKSQKAIREAQVSNTQEDTKLKGVQQETALATASAQQADARLKNAEAAIKEARGPFNARNAEIESLTLDRQFQMLGRDLEIKGFQSGMSMLELKYLPEVQELANEYSRLRNKAEELGLSEKEAESKFWETVESGGKYAKYGGEFLRMLKMILK